MDLVDSLCGHSRAWLQRILRELRRRTLLLRSVCRCVRCMKRRNRVELRIRRRRGHRGGVILLLSDRFLKLFKPKVLLRCVVKLMFVFCVTINVEFRLWTRMRVKLCPKLLVSARRRLTKLPPLAVLPALFRTCRRFMAVWCVRSRWCLPIGGIVSRLLSLTPRAVRRKVNVVIMLRQKPMSPMVKIRRSLPLF